MWAGASPNPDEDVWGDENDRLAKAYRAAGMDERAIAKKLGRPVDPGIYEIWPDCWDAVRVFILLGRQWRFCVAPSGHIVREGLDFSALPVVLSGLGLVADEQLLNDLRIMENAAVEVFTENIKNSKG